VISLLVIAAAVAQDDPFVCPELTALGDEDAVYDLAGLEPYDAIQDAMSVWYDEDCIDRSGDSGAEEIGACTTADGAWMEYRRDWSSHGVYDFEYTVIPPEGGADWTWAHVEGRSTGSHDPYGYGYSTRWTARWLGTLVDGWPADRRVSTDYDAASDGWYTDIYTESWDDGECSWEIWDYWYDGCCDHGYCETIDVLVNGSGFEVYRCDRVTCTDDDGVVQEGTMAHLHGEPVAVVVYYNLELLCDLDQDDDGYGSLTWGGTDCDDSSAGRNPAAVERCDGVDNDCDGLVDDDDDDLADGWYPDVDGDGAGDTSAAACAVFEGAVATGGDCDDGDAAIGPHATEIWYDGVDQDCDGGSDYDQDGDGDDIDTATGGTDCDDMNASIHGDALEVCDGIDNDCDGSMDEGDAMGARGWYYDADGDGYCSEDPAERACEPSGADSCERGDDCDDSDPEVHVDAEEVYYDGVDQDCDGGSDYDQDGDGWSYGHFDCDDQDDSVNWDADEVCCDGVDQDCDGHDDMDCDGDGYDCAEFGGDDCDDGDPSVHPGATDIPDDGVDSDCDGRDAEAPVDDPEDTGDSEVDEIDDEVPEEGCAGCTSHGAGHGGLLSLAASIFALGLRRRRA